MEAHTGMPRPTSNKPFDIKERTFLFSVEVVKWAKLMPRDYGTQVLLRQALRAATSIGANVEEADGATTEKDQVYKWAVARKEARETRYWLRLLSATATPSPVAGNLEQEASELIRILSALINKHKSQERP